MAVNIVAEPATNRPAGACVEFELELTDAGAGTTKKSLGYQLYNDSNGELTTEEQIPYTGAPEKVNFSRDLLPQASTPFPGVGTQLFGVPVPEAKVGYYLKYGEILFDTETCTVTKNITSQSATKYVYNVAPQFFLDHDLFTGNSYVHLTSKPRLNFTRRGQNDWIYIWVASGATMYVRLTYQTSDGTFTQNVQSFPGGDGVNVLSVGPANCYVTLPSDVVFYYLEFNTSPSWNNKDRFWFRVQTDCTDEAPINEIYWLEPMGGFAGLKFDQVEIGITLASNRYQAPVPCSATATQRSQGYGNTRYGTTGTKRVILRREIEYRDGLDQYLDGLKASSTHFIKWPISGSTIIAKLVVSDESSYRFNSDNDNIQLEIVGDIHLPINAL